GRRRCLRGIDSSAKAFSMPGASAGAGRNISKAAPIGSTGCGTCSCSRPGSKRTPEADTLRKALFLANTDWYLWNFRLPLLRALRDRGWDVVLATPPGPWSGLLEAEGFRWVEFDFARHGLNPFAEFNALAR